MNATTRTLVLIVAVSASSVLLTLLCTGHFSGGSAATPNESAILEQPPSTERPEVALERAAQPREVVLAVPKVDEPNHRAQEKPGDALRKRMSGGLTRQSDPALYEETIFALALEGVLGHRKLQQDGVAAGFLGFSKLENVERKVEELEQLDPNLAQTLRDLSAEAVKAAASVDRCVEESWGDPFHLEVFDRENPHDRKTWPSHRETGKDGLFRFGTSTSIGDRAFIFHFDSQFFPGLEADLQNLETAQEAFWALEKEVQWSK